MAMNNLSYLFAAYSLIFAVIFLYVLFLWRRQVALGAELNAVEARLDALRKAQSSAGKTPSAT